MIIQLFEDDELLPAGQYLLEVIDGQLTLAWRLRPTATWGPKVAAK